MTTTLTPQSSTYIDPVDRPVVRHIGLARTAAQSATMGYRGLLKLRHNPEQLTDVVLLPVIFTLMFSYIFGGAVAGDVTSYLPMIVPGILVQTVITGSVVTGTQLREDMDKGVFDRFRSLPIARISPLAGALMADVIRYLIAAVVCFLTGFAMGYHPAGGALGLVGAVLLVMFCAWAISWIFALLGTVMNKASSVQGISMLVLFPLTFLSNAFVDTSTMPSWLRAFADINPVSHLVTAVRELANNGHFGIHVVYSLVGAVVIVAIFAPLTVKSYMRKA
ncbi:ABC transporter [Rhodococcus sp. 06-412-2C]|uniref:ABC transporter permease n=1 Tax=unclassified Rhodococcus (in: high G+C Gram-positive bacteria) TaxID=192944 RepID=UPI000B9A21D6|nr:MULTISPECIES: ABC transporter permease [unclassified Rhodococcus (in: high G+C Gram-positive bacteria)]OZC90870.1 ABC transporter [Rhodococcus sp. 06-412-2C]OZC97875.1 ABC transporter [Rhodococcus sp. 06-412-2B]